MVWKITPSNLLVDDPDAVTYLAAVEAADGQALEAGVRRAVNAFIKGCKADGIWPAIKASCILAGARTLAGAFTPLVGSAPTRNGTAGGWNYNRKTGVQGNGTDNWIDSARALNADPTLSQHALVYISTAGFGVYLGGFTGNNGYTHIDSGNILMGSNTSISVPAGTTGVIGASRNDNTGHTGRRAGASVFASNAAGIKIVNLTCPILAYRNNGGSIQSYSSGRLAFYSIGESFDLALLDARVTTLVNALAAAIP